MKKLLSLLSVLTISGTAVPTTIAASSYQKENNNNNLKETIKTESNNKQQEKNNKIISLHKYKNNLWKTASIFVKIIAKTADNIKNNLVDKSKNDNLKINKRQDNKKEENNKITSRHRNKKTKRIKRMWKTININQYIPNKMTVYIPSGFAASNNPPDGTAIRKMASLRIKEQLGIDIPIYCINLNYLTRSGVTIKINYFDTINKITYTGIQYTVFTPIS